MTFFSKPAVLSLVAVTLCTGVLLGGQAQAQSTQGMEMLTAEERQEFNRRLQFSAASSERAKITSEMNRLVRERTLAKRNAELNSKANARKKTKRGNAGK